MTISDAYRRSQQTLHSEESSYGTASVTLAELVVNVLERVEPADFLDYGAGKQRLIGAMRALGKPLPKYYAYDPAIPEISAPPEPAEVVVCLDVLEHVEPEHLNAVIDDLHRVTKRFLLAAIETGPASRILEDGRNAHLIQEPMEWWVPKFWERFKITNFSTIGPTRFWFTADPR